MEENNQKITFFKRIKIAIFKLEDYGFFLGERFKVAFKYLLLLILILSIIISIVDTYKLNQMLSTGYKYITNELPDFSYENDMMIFPEQVEAYDEKYQFKLLINTSENISEEEINNYKNKIYDKEYGIIVLREKFVYMISGVETEYSYKEFFNISSLELKNKNDLQKMFSREGISAIITAFFMSDIIVIYISNLLTILGDIVVIALFGLIAARFCGLKFKTAPMFSLAIYSLTLSIILTAIYSIVYAITGFVVEYFNVMYLLIAYVYIIAAILMIKYDLIKQHFELEKILEVQKQVHEELKEQEEKDKEKEKENSEEKDSKEENKPENEEENNPEINNREPDGSEI